MSQGRLLAIAFIVGGALLALLSLTADFFQGTVGAVGSSFGWKQLLGTVLGVMILAAGVVLLRQGDGGDDEEYDEDEEDGAEVVAAEEFEDARGRR